MSKFQNPIVLATRPQQSSQHFLSALDDVSGSFIPLVCPAFEVVGTGAARVGFDAAIFTSQTATRFAPEGRGRTAYCVGDITASVARSHGYDVVSAGGSAKDLISLIRAHEPEGRLLHIRGEKSVGNVMGNLNALGITCEESIVYRKQPQSLDTSVKARLEGGVQTLIPVFSAETVSLLADWRVCFKDAHVIAISPTVAQLSGVLGPLDITVAAAPTLDAMIASTSALIA